MKLATVGYENDTQAAVIERLKAAKVEVVIDVRAVASSRKAGFSKTILAASLDEAGIAYVHLQKLGTPKAGREAARAGRTDEMHRIFEAHLAEPAAQLELAKAGERIAGQRKSAPALLRGRPQRLPPADRGRAAARSARAGNREPLGSRFRSS